MAYGLAIMAALAATNIGLRASGTIQGPSAPPPRPGKTAGGGMSGVPYSPVGKGKGGIPYNNPGAGGFDSLDGGGRTPMIGNRIPNAGNTGLPDVIGALSGTPAASMGGPIGMLSNAPSTGTGMTGQMPLGGGALSSGGMSPGRLQMILAGLNTGTGLMAGQPADQAAQGFISQGVMPAMMAQQGGAPSSLDNIPPPQGADPEDFARFVQMIKAKGMGGAGLPGLPGGAPYGGMG